MWRRAWRKCRPAGAGGGGLGVALAPESACRQMEGRIAVCALPAALSQAMVYAVTRRQGRRRALDSFLQAAAQGGPR